ncbi:hypothetical protein KY285_016610 [Solanum tuberosum]|nr:hypothetical protein KY284_016619 [Solanum tuberosum]KAH0702332.1 hypothetical protein KY285_016610 [Solanum tuberosum]
MTKTEENNDSSRLGATKQPSPCPCIVRSIHVAPQGQVNRSKASIRPFLFRNGLESQEKDVSPKGNRVSVAKVRFRSARSSFQFAAPKKLICRSHEISLRTQNMYDVPLLSMAMNPLYPME